MCVCVCVCACMRVCENMRVWVCGISQGGDWYAFHFVCRSCHTCVECYVPMAMRMTRINMSYMCWRCSD